MYENTLCPLIHHSFLIRSVPTSAGLARQVRQAQLARRSTTSANYWLFNRERANIKSNLDIDQSNRSICSVQQQNHSDVHVLRAPNQLLPRYADTKHVLQTGTDMDT